MKALAYLRVSTKRQAAEGESLPAQADDFARYCDRQGLEPFAVTWDHQSGGNTKRPGLQLALRLLRQGAAKYLVVSDLDRAFRGALDAFSIVQQLDRWKVDIRGTRQELDRSTPEGRLVFNMLAVVAEYELERIRKRAQDIAAYKRRRGEYLGGKVPYGFEIEQQNGRRLLVPVEKELAVVARIRRLRAEGYRGKPMSYKAIARLLMREGIPTKNGHDWHSSTVHYICENTLYGAVDPATVGV